MFFKVVATEQEGASPVVDARHVKRGEPDAHACVLTHVPKHIQMHSYYSTYDIPQFELIAFKLDGYY